MAPESIGLYNRYEGILNQSHQYLLDDIRLLEDIPAFIQDASYILSSASSPFLVDQKNYTITIPTLADPEWGHQKIVWAGKKTPLITAIEILTEKYASLLPSICTNTTLPLEYIDTQLIFFLMSDIVGAINIYALHQKKR